MLLDTPGEMVLSFVDTNFIHIVLSSIKVHIFVSGLCNFSRYYTPFIYTRTKKDRGAGELNSGTQMAIISQITSE